MGISCKLGLHATAPGQIWNDGYFFATCRRCGCALIRRPGLRWHAVPRGYAVAWRRVVRDDARSTAQADLGDNAPADARGMIRNMRDRIRRAIASQEVARTDHVRAAARRRTAESRTSCPEPDEARYKPLGDPAPMALDWRALSIGNDPANDVADEGGEPLHWPPQAPELPPVSLLHR